MRYTCKSMSVDAEQWEDHNTAMTVASVAPWRIPGDSRSCAGCGGPMYMHGMIDRLVVCPGAWVVSTVDGLSVVSPSVFAARYEEDPAP